MDTTEAAVPSSPNLPQATRRPLSRADSGISLGSGSASVPGLSSLEDSGLLGQGRRLSDGSTSSGDGAFEAAGHSGETEPAPAPDFSSSNTPPSTDTDLESPLVDTGSLLVLPESHTDAVKKDTGFTARISRLVERTAAFGIVAMPLTWAFLVTVGLIYQEVDIFLE